MFDNKKNSLYEFRTSYDSSVSIFFFFLIVREEFIITFIFFFLNFLNILCFILIVPFFIFFERRFLGVLQLRFGVFFYFFNSFFLFLCDALKIISKYNVFILSSSSFMLNFSSFFFFALGIFLCFFFFFMNSIIFSFIFSLLFFLLIFSFLPFPLINVSYVSNSIYSFLGNLRTIFLLISYEIVLIFSLISGLIYFSFKIYSGSSYYFYFLYIPVFFILYISILCETSRVPFDLIEGESELVSGFNVELGSVNFVLIFLGEYLILCIFLAFLNCFLSFFNFFILIILFLFSRALLVRYFFFNILRLF